ncbi:MAG: hypothetical protein RIR18_2404 [Pseudomonadota bacterium]|jgi:putative glycosyltransferase (TIGR04372 family)
MYKTIVYEPGLNIDFGFGEAKQQADLDKLLNIIDLILIQNNCSKSVVWNMYQIDRLGHTMFEPEAIKAMLGIDFNDLAIIIPNNRQFCNESMFRFAVMGAQLIFTDAEWLVRVMHSCRAVVERNDRKYVLLGGHIYEEYSDHLALGGAPGRYNLTQMDYLSGFEDDLLSRYHLNAQQKLVVLHNREGGWFNAVYHNHRNSNIQNFFPSIRYLISLGYIVVRIGDATMQKLPDIDGVIDLPFDPRKQEFDDLIFIKLSSFYIGSTSGPYDLPRFLGKPVLAHNVAELPGSIDDQFLLFKNYYHRKLKRTLSYLEIFTSRAGFVTQMEEFQSLDIFPIENGPNELLMSIAGMVRVAEFGLNEDDLDYIKHANKLNKIIGSISKDDDSKFADRIFSPQYLGRCIPTPAYKDIDPGFVSIV